MAGVEVNISEGAGLTVANGKNVYVYDAAEWNSNNFVWGSCKFKSVAYAPGKAYNRTNADLKDVKMDVNGSVTALGAIYTTKGGADICSSKKTGKYIQQGTPGTKTTTYQYDGNKNSHAISITAAKLHNADGSYTETKEAKAKETFTYCKGQECGGGKWVKNLKVAAIGITEYDTLQGAVTKFLQDSSSSNTYIKMLHSTTENIPTGNINITKDLYLDLNGCTVTGTFDMRGKTLYGMDSTTDNYDGTKAGKIVGTVTGNVAPVHKTSAKTVDGYDSLRYVAIQSENSYSFHRFNISVSGYRFELAAPKCALFFIGKFQGDKAARDYLTSLGFTLKDIDGKTTNPRYEIPAGKDIPPMPAKGKASDSEVVRDVGDNDAYLFEAYLMHDIDKENYQTQFSAIAHATFKNSGNSEDNSLSSVKRNLSFKEAWEDALKGSGMDPKDREILTKFLSDNGLNISNP